MKTKSTLIIFLIGCLFFYTTAFSQSNSSFVFATNDVVSSGAKLMKVNKTNGTVTQVGSLLFSSSGCAFDPFTQHVYYTEAQSGGSAPFDLAYYDLATNTNTKIGNGILGSNAFVKLAINPTNGKMYGIESESSSGKTTENLYEINKSTGAKTLIKTVLKISGTANGDLSFDKNGNCYYLAADKVYTLDVASGTATSLVTITPSNTRITGITTDENLDLLVSTYQNPGGSCNGSGDWIAKVGLPDGKLTCVGNANTMLGDLTGGYGVAGIANMLLTVSNIGTVYTLVYEIKVKNYGMSRLDNLQITDDLQEVFGSGLLSASVAATGTLPAGVTLNALYNGSTNASLLGSGNYLSFSYPVATEFTVRVTATVNIPAADMNVIFYTQPRLTSTDPAANTLTDYSDDGFNPNVNNNSSAHETGEDDPTPFSVNMVLPVKLTGFTAVTSNKSVKLDWKTASEIGVQQFIVEASVDGINFNRIVKIVSASNLPGGASYSTTDNQPFNGLNYYRLKMVDIDHAVAYSSIKIVNLNLPGIAIQVFPNPAVKTLKIQLPVSMKGATTLQVVNLQGAVVEKMNVDAVAGSIISINVDRLNNGVYMLQVKNAATTTSTRFVKM